MEANEKKWDNKVMFSRYTKLSMIKVSEEILHKLPSC